MRPLLSDEEFRETEAVSECGNNVYCHGIIAVYVYLCIYEEGSECVQVYMTISGKLSICM